MVVIRLARSGSKKNPFYNIVVADRRRPRDGRFIERIGFYNPMARGEAMRLQLAKDRAEHWIQLGAQPSERVSKLLQEVSLPEGAAKEKTPTRAQLRKMQAETAAKSKKPAQTAEEESASEENS